MASLLALLDDLDPAFIDATLVCLQRRGSQFGDRGLGVDFNMSLPGIYTVTEKANFTNVIPCHSSHFAILPNGKSLLSNTDLWFAE